MNAKPDFLDVEGVPIAFLKQSGVEPGFVWLGGFMSEMRGAKAEALAGWAAEAGRAFVRHDYSGHGESGGNFADGTISRWLAESLAVFEAHAQGPQILVGSSMGGWIALRMVQELAKRGERARIAGMILIAPAPDFTSDLRFAQMSPEQRRELETTGQIEKPSAYSDEPYVYTRALFEDGKENRVMTGIIDTRCPVHIIQGLADPDVPFAHALKLAEHLPADDVTVTLVKDGDHRLSRPEDIDLLLRTAGEMAQRIGAV